MKRQAAEVFVNEHRLSIQRACRILGLSRTAYYRVPTDAAARDAAVITVLNEIAQRPRWGFCVNGKATFPTRGKSDFPTRLRCVVVG